jgi:hypothetical protein
MSRSLFSPAPFGLLLLLVLPGRPLRAEAPPELKAALTPLGASSAVSARVELQRTQTREDEHPGAEATATVTARVMATPEGLQILWPAAQIEAAAREARQPEAGTPRPVRQAMDALSVSALDGYLNAGRELLRELEHSELQTRTTDTWRGQPARRLDFKLLPPLSEKDRKYIKELDARAQVWVNEAGVPLAAESRVFIKGRALLVIRFESTEVEKYEFAQVAGRLVVARHEHQSSGSGGGETHAQKTVTTLAFAPAG